MSYQINVFDYLSATADRVPNKIAFCDEKVSYTFSSLWHVCQAGGTAVADAAGAPNRPVVVLVDRTALSVAAMLSVLAAGCWYVPIDRRTPEDRLRAMFSAFSPALILYPAADAKKRELLSSFAPVLEAETALAAAPDAARLAAARERVLDVDPAYMIFTSGSTGTPKGIPVSHRSVIDFTEWMAEASGVTEDDVLGNQAPFYFDLSVKDLYQTLRSGATTHILPQKLFMFPLLLTKYLNEHRITTLIWATSAFRLVAASGVFERETLPHLRRVLLGGEALQAAHLNVWKKAAPACRFTNLYGPTEVTVDCTFFPITRDYADDEPIPIGKACRNMEVLLLDDELRPVPPGEAGEICVRGAGLALGYYGDPDKTAAAFVRNPLNPHYPERIYRTGDIGRADADGNIYFLSRRDGQIKHMGYRIELGEVETALSGISGIAEAVCLFDREGDRLLCVYSGTLTDAELARAMGAKLPKYMQPNDYHRRDALPHNANGKIDRVALKKELLP